MTKSECAKRNLCTILVLLAHMASSATNAENGQRTAGCSPDRHDVQGKISDGMPAVKGRFPYMVSLKRWDGGHACGGTLIHPSAILTAAHCVYWAPNPVVHIGAYGVSDAEEEGAKVARVSATVVHPKYDRCNLMQGYDLAVLILKDPVHSVPIPKLPGPREEVGPGTNVHTLGWGRLSDTTQAMPDVLQIGNKQHVLPDVCIQGYRLPEDLFLRLGEDQTRQGDSGGPAIVPGGNPAEDLIVGITSFSDKHDKTEGIYTRMSGMMVWTLSVIKKIDDIKQHGSAAVPIFTQPPRGSFCWKQWITAFNIAATALAIMTARASWLFISAMGRRGGGQQGLAPAARPVATPTPVMQQTGAGEAQHQDGTFDNRTFESHADSTPPRPTSLGELPEPSSLAMSSSCSDKIEAYNGVKHTSPWIYEQLSMYICGGPSDIGCHDSDSGEHLPGVGVRQVIPYVSKPMWMYTSGIPTSGDIDSKDSHIGGDATSGGIGSNDSHSVDVPQRFNGAGHMYHFNAPSKSEARHPEFGAKKKSSSGSTGTGDGSRGVRKQLNGKRNTSSVNRINDVKGRTHTGEASKESCSGGAEKKILTWVDNSARLNLRGVAPSDGSGHCNGDGCDGSLKRGLRVREISLDSSGPRKKVLNWGNDGACSSSRGGAPRDGSGNCSRDDGWLKWGLTLPWRSFRSSSWSRRGAGGSRGYRKNALSTGREDAAGSVCCMPFCVPRRVPSLETAGDAMSRGPLRSSEKAGCFK